VSIAGARHVGDLEKRGCHACVRILDPLSHRLGGNASTSPMCREFTAADRVR